MPNITTFTTEGLSPAESITAWTAHINESIFDALIVSYAPDGLRASKTARHMGDLTIHSITSNEHIVQRSIEKALDNPLDFIFFSAVVSGRCVFYSPTLTEIIDVGEVLAYDPGQAYVLGVEANSVHVFIRVPRAYFCRELGFEFPSQARKARVGFAGLPELSVSALQDLSRNIGDSDIADAVLLEQSRMLIDVAVQLSFVGETHGVLGRATAAIEEMHDNPGTKSGEIARAINVSLRQLDRLFAERGTSTAKQITVVRVGHARRLMADSSLSISEIAYRCGFGSADTMTRQFKSLFGATPQVVRETIHSAAGPGDASPGEHRHLRGATPHPILANTLAVSRRVLR